MPLTATDITGDGKTVPMIIASVELPDSGTSVLVTGQVQNPGGPVVALTGSPLTMPAAPGSGNIFWNIQVNVASGAATVQQSTTADPPALAGNVVVFRQTLASGVTNPATVATDSTPDTW